MKYSISERIKIFREYKNLKQYIFAKLIGVSPSTLSEVENGKNNAPSTSLIIGIANTFIDLNIEWLLTEKGEMLKEDVQDEIIDTNKIVEKIESLNNKEKIEVLNFINEKQHIHELENLIVQLTEQSNQ
jgi:transcriptional regulator with XRE-family HTH domain